MTEIDRLLLALDATDRGRRATVSVTVGEREPAAVPAEVSLGLYDLLRLTQAGTGFVVLPLRRDLTTTQAALALGVSRRTLRRMIAAGELPSHKVGSHARIRYADVADARRRLEMQAAENATAARLDLSYVQRPTPPASGV